MGAMAAMAFEGLGPAADAWHVGWAVEAMEGRQGVALVVPDLFEACARILHRREDGRRWRDVDPTIVEGDGRDAWARVGEGMMASGSLEPDQVDVLVEVLAEHTAPGALCHYGLWVGWGGLRRSSSGAIYSPAGHGPLRRRLHERRARRAAGGWRDRQVLVEDFVAACPERSWWGGRDMILFDGPLDAVRAVGTPSVVAGVDRQSPQWWWPDDRRWFVATEIDDGWSYVAGSRALIDQVVDGELLEATEVAFTDPW
jgi:hypothetical protein